MPLAVVNMAMLQCMCGAAPTPLTVTSNMQVMIGNQLTGTIMDFAPMANIKPFGPCTILTSAASGVPTPCVPAAPAPWTPGAAKTMIGYFPALQQSDKLTCAVGG
jgi:hypothetical protein